MADRDVARRDRRTLAQDRAAPDREIGFGETRAVGELRGEGQAVGVLGQEGAGVEDDVGIGEGHRMRAGERQRAPRADLRQDRRRRIGIEPLGLPAGKAEDRRGIGGMAAPGEREAAVEVAADAHGYRPLPCRTLGKVEGRAHRANGMRARRADADREELGDADRPVQAAVEE